MSITRRELITAAVVGAAGAATVGATSAAPAFAAPRDASRRRPNIILIMVDEMRYPQHFPTGIASAEDAYARIRAGASLIQIYSALVYEGPGLAQRINAGLARLLRRDGFAHVADAVGVDLR